MNDSKITEGPSTGTINQNLGPQVGTINEETFGGDSISGDDVTE